MDPSDAAKIIEKEAAERAETLLNNLYVSLDYLDEALAFGDLDYNQSFDLTAAADAMRRVVSSLEGK